MKVPGANTAVHLSARHTSRTQSLRNSLQNFQRKKVTYKSGKSTCYYEYEAKGDNLLSVITRLPFKLKTHARIDSTYRAMNTPFSLSGQEILTKEEITASAFFWRIDPDEFDYYECLKDSDRHTVLINKKTKQILHRIESV